MNEKLLLREREACDRLGLGRSKLLALTYAGEIESVRIGSARRWTVDGLNRFVDRLREADDNPTPAT